LEILFKKLDKKSFIICNPIHNNSLCKTQVFAKKPPRFCDYYKFVITI